ncbi:type III restriction/modification enzyme methylation subunit-domain-containing protein [Glomus cerebriforme]|uniref:Type III restriction/modification enzyme methylation subunit-domain-containing protein n=1 Tax=Glomus cerebriforme TaxID=658196 RepID=A0A397S7Q6_9GLOM|nr:type III restriction/modification enzyme methylation subunit-domain-containing protein [Glomus cerebriforme]
METVLQSNKSSYEKKIALFNCLKEIKVEKLEPSEEQRVKLFVRGKMKFQKTIETLITLLKNDERLVVNRELLKSTIIELTLKQDLNLLKLLMSSPEIKQKFFTEVEKGVLVFNQIKFQNFISNKQFLPDSFTQYKNKIGLVADRQYLANSGEVVLA